MLTTVVPKYSPSLGSLKLPPFENTATVIGTFVQNTSKISDEWNRGNHFKTAVFYNYVSRWILLKHPQCGRSQTLFKIFCFQCMNFNINIYNFSLKWSRRSKYDEFCGKYSAILLKIVAYIKKLNKVQRSQL